MRLSKPEALQNTFFPSRKKKWLRINHALPDGSFIFYAREGRRKGEENPQNILQHHKKEYFLLKKPK